MWRSLTLVLLLGCGNKNNTPVPTEDAVEPADGGAHEDEGSEPDADAGGEDAGGEDAVPEQATPASLYAECKDRLEQPQAEGECTADTDCTTGGCGGEVCSTAAGLADWMSTCEVKPCFQVVEACGCHDGMCSWTLKDVMPEIKAPSTNTLPPTRLPPSPPAKKGSK